jgi:hypothetical protein
VPGGRGVAFSNLRKEKLIKIVEIEIMAINLLFIYMIELGLLAKNVNI